MRGSLPVLPRPLVKGIPGAVTNFIFLFVIFLFFFFFFAGGGGGGGEERERAFY